MGNYLKMAAPCDAAPTSLTTHLQIEPFLQNGLTRRGKVVGATPKPARSHEETNRKGFKENLVLQRFASSNALKLTNAIFQLLHVGIANNCLAVIHDHRASLAQEPTPALQEVWRNTTSSRRRGVYLPNCIAFLDDLQFAFRWPASPPDVANHQIELSKLFRRRPILKPSCFC